ncbi:hypothetical protein ABQX22_26120 [Xanthomonas sp. WHRI 1810A]|uniref:hypothetical protein n=1 Tax=Xanthomonas sp. WHRI 1810A TaxID=3161565 RepID=UPI0032E8AAB7
MIQVNHLARVLFCHTTGKARLVHSISVGLIHYLIEVNRFARLPFVAGERLTQVTRRFTRCIGAPHRGGAQMITPRSAW